MKVSLFILPLFFLLFVSCGYSSKDSEAVGQVKRVLKHTPIICQDWTQVDLSLGVMRNGVGSVSHEDILLYVPTEELARQLQTAAESGAPVKVKYDVARFAFCVGERQVRSVEILK